MAKTLVYDSYSDTIRQMPENYLIAERTVGSRWVTDTDGAADKELATKVFLALFEFENKYARNGQELVDRINAS
jgi:hypothetical protein